MTGAAGCRCGSGRPPSRRPSGAPAPSHRHVVGRAGAQAGESLLERQLGTPGTSSDASRSSSKTPPAVGRVEAPLLDRRAEDVAAVGARHEVAARRASSASRPGPRGRAGAATWPLTGGRHARLRGRRQRADRGAGGEDDAPGRELARRQRHPRRPADRRRARARAHRGRGRGRRARRGLRGSAGWSPGISRARRRSAPAPARRARSVGGSRSPPSPGRGGRRAPAERRGLVAVPATTSVPLRAAAGVAPLGASQLGGERRPARAPREAERAAARCSPSAASLPARASRRRRATRRAPSARGRAHHAQAARAARQATLSPMAPPPMTTRSRAVSCCRCLLLPSPA